MLADIQPRQRTWPTLAWTGAGILALILSQVVGVLVYVVGIRLTHPGQVLSTHTILHNGSAVIACTMLAAAAIVPFVWALTRIRTGAVADYLALRWPRPREAILGMIGFVCFLVALSALSHQLLSPRDTNYLLNFISEARATHAVPLLVGTVAIAGPLSEELVFRGFLYRTIELRFGDVAAMIVTALGWAALHIQYGVVGIAMVFAVGMFLGAMRRYYRSLYLTMAMHVLWNGAALAGAMLMTTGPNL